MPIPPGVRTITGVTATPHPATSDADALANTPRRSLRRTNALILAATLALSGGLLAACGGGGGGGSTASAAEPVAVATTQPLPPGEAQYKKSCARCHGVGMQGRNGTPAMDARRIATQPDQILAMQIQFGKGKMPAFGGLTAEQIDNIISYLRTLV